MSERARAEDRVDRSAVLPRPPFLRRRPTRLALRMAAFLLMAAVLLLSVVPPGWRPVTPAPHALEHLAVFVLIGAALGLGFPGRLMSCLSGLLLFAGAVETIQMWVPGRHARLGDFAVHVVAIGVGLGGAWLATRIVARLRMD